MAVIVDATGTKLITTVAGASVNYSGITVGTGANALVVTVACAAAVTAPNAHWDTAGANQAMTLITAVETATNVTTFMFGLRNPVAGLKTLNVAWTTSAKSNIEAISFTGAETTSDAKAFINANFASNAATVASIAIGLTSPADSIAVASYATTATFSSITQTNIFTDTTNTGCEGGASRANGAGASILFTGADTGTTGNKVIVGFVVAPPPPVPPGPWQNPSVLAKKGLAIALMASGLFTAPLPVKEDTPRLEWTVSWQDPVRAKPGLGVQHQPSLAWSTFTPATTAVVASEDGSSGPIFKYRLIYKAKTEPIVFTAATPPTGWNDPLEQPVRNWRRSTAYTAPFLALGVPPAQVWFPPNVTPDVVPTRAKPPVNFIPWTFLEPAPQVFFPYDRWPDKAPAAKRVAQNPDWSYGTFVTPTAIPTYTQWTQWPDFANKIKPVVNFIPWTFLEPAPQVFFPYGPWDDFARKKPQPLDTQPLDWGTFTPAPVVSTAVVAGEDGSFGPIFRWRLIYRVKTEPVFVPPAPAPTMAWVRWPDFAPRAKPLVDIRPWTFVPTPKQVFFPYAPWDDFTRRKSPPLDTQPQPFLAPQAAQYQTVVFDWPDFATRKPQPLDTQPLIWSGFTPAPAAAFFLVPDRWPDFATRKKPVADFIPWSFIPTPQQVFFPYGPWDNFARKKPQPLDTQPLIWSTFTPAPVVSPDIVAGENGSTGPIFKWRLIYRVKTEPIFVPPVVVTYSQLASWPDIIPTRKKPVVDFIPWTFIPAPAQVFFPYGPWDDFARRRQPPLDTQPLDWSTFTPAPAVTYFTSPWPDFASRKKPAADFVPWTFIPTPRQVFFPYGPWDDFARRKRPLNYDPLAFLQTVRTPWVTMTTWPDFAPIRGKIGLHPAQQQFTARFPGTLFGATVTLTMSAFEVNTDGAAAAILVVQSQPAVDAAVSIKEIGILGGSITP